MSNTCQEEKGEEASVVEGRMEGSKQNQTYPRASAREDVAAAEDGRERGEHEREDPEADDDGHEVAVLQGARQGHLGEGVQGDGQHEEAARHVAQLDQPALGEADGVRADDGALRRPVERDEEAERLEQVREDELVDEHDALVAPDEAGVV